MVGAPVTARPGSLFPRQGRTFSIRYESYTLLAGAMLKVKTDIE